MTGDELLRGLVAGRDLRDSVPREDLAARAAHHGLSAYVLENAPAANLRLPAEVRARLEADARAAGRLRAVLDLELIRIVAAYPVRDRPPIVVKGPAVASRYRDPRLRVYTDIDLLVSREDVDPWRAALARLGYRPPADARSRDALRFGHELKMTRPGTTRPLLAEIHWRLFSERRARRVGYESLVRHASPAPFATGALALDPPALLVALGLHLGHHSRAAHKLKWLVDLIELGEPEAVSEARRVAASLGVGWALEQALHDAEELLGEPRWAARPEPATGLSAARRSTATGWRHHFAVARDLGPFRGFIYAITRLNPRLRRRRSR